MGCTSKAKLAWWTTLLLCTRLSLSRRPVGAGVGVGVIRTLIFRGGMLDLVLYYYADVRSSIVTMQSPLFF